MSFWQDAPTPATSQRGNRSRTQLASTQEKPIYFHNEADVARYYPPVARAPTMRRKRPGGSNVIARANQEMSRDAARGYINSQKTLRNVSTWHENQGDLLDRSQKLRRSTVLKEERRVAADELKILRRERLRALLEDELEGQKEELRAMGLALLE